MLTLRLYPGHTAASRAKRAANALVLSGALTLVKTDDILKRALKQWKDPQLMLGDYLYWQGSMVGNYLIKS